MRLSCNLQQFIYNCYSYREREDYGLPLGLARFKGSLVKQFNVRPIKSTTAARTPLSGPFCFRSFAL